LLARVHAVLRRANLVRGSKWRDENLSIGEITLNLQQMHAVVSGRRVGLTPRELSLLHTLMDNPNRVLSREQLMELAWGQQAVGSKAVDVYIQRLRKKLDPHVKRPYIRSEGSATSSRCRSPRSS
jgi:DNA-binding response OmpR family regulator